MDFQDFHRCSLILGAEKTEEPGEGGSGASVHILHAKQKKRRGLGEGEGASQLSHLGQVENVVFSRNMWQTTSFRAGSHR